MSGFSQSVLSLSSQVLYYLLSASPSHTHTHTPPSSLPTLNFSSLIPLCRSTHSFLSLLHTNEGGYSSTNKVQMIKPSTDPQIQCGGGCSMSSAPTISQEVEGAGTNKRRWAQSSINDVQRVRSIMNPQSNVKG